MTLVAGTKLGPYEILSALGAGGMGEVYRARDSKLGREVAVKVLPAELAANPEALSRFEREAQAVAQLSHPIILAIHDFGRQGETVYAVMELLEGETLRTRSIYRRFDGKLALNCFVIVGGEIAIGDEVHLVRGRACVESAAFIE